VSREADLRQLDEAGLDHVDDHGDRQDRECDHGQSTDDGQGVQDVLVDTEVERFHVYNSSNWGV
jgi:hypothetical protein